MKKGIKIIINISLIAILIYSASKTLLKLWDYKKSEDTYNSIEAIYNENKEEEKFNKLKKMNSNYKFWINVENTNINYPVVQGMDNSYYLKKDFLNNNSGSGTIFLDYQNNFEDDFNNIIYGHNMKNGALFSALENYKNKEFFEANNRITLTDINKKYIYEVFSVYVVDGKADMSNLQLINQSNDNGETLDYLNILKSKSIFNSNIDLTDREKIITLATCSYETKNSRTIIHGKLSEVLEL